MSIGGWHCFHNARGSAGVILTAAHTGNPMREEHHTEDHADIREAVAKLCAQFPGEYWRKLDREMAYPKAFVDALTEAGYLSVLIPEEYGGAGLKLSAAAAILEEIQRAGCNGGGCRRSASPSRPAAPILPRSRPSPGAKATTAISSMARKSGPAAPNIPI